MSCRGDKPFAATRSLYLRALLCGIILLLTSSQTRGAVLDSEVKKPQSNIATVRAIKCFEKDPDFARFKICELKPINRTLKVITVRVNMLQLPLSNASINFTLFKRSNGYRLFFINFTIDACKYLAGQRMRLFDWVYDALEPYTNVNHTCPYESDLLIEKFPVSAIKLPPLYPEGDYRFDYRFLSYNVIRSIIQIFIDVKEQ